MPTKLKLAMIVFSVLLILAILNFIKRDKIPVKYSLPWLLIALILLILGICPTPVLFLQSLIGFETLSNMLLFILIGLLLLITLFLTVVVSKQRKQINLLVQEISLNKKGK